MQQKRKLKNYNIKEIYELGLPMSNAVNIFLRQVILQKGIPFDLTIVPKESLVYNNLTVEQFNHEIEKGLENLASGKVLSAQNVAERMQREYGV
ncbi:MAG TPA: type II toxin-antitoxin system antitoxin, RelB/DinJ family [Clostridiales bacterium]|nr:type II toxin-antitoxin system antitoxin, RelB/DinJ family [Clostridiales bacterium]